MPSWVLKLLQLLVSLLPEIIKGFFVKPSDKCPEEKK
jgi:hypothetical protein